MYKTCPKCGHTRDGDPAAAESCPACGLVYAKWLASRYAEARRPAEEVPVEMPGPGARLYALLLDQEPGVDPLVVYGRALVYAAFAVWGLYFVGLELDSNAIGGSFMHSVNLVFHEAGHVLFRPFGEFMMYLGGSLGQLLVPLVVAGALLLQGDRFGASVGLWWLGQSAMDVAPYINDARALALPLLGGGTGMDRPGMHDWNWLLMDLGWLERDHAIAAVVDTAGEGLVLLALAWGGWILWQQYRTRA